MLALKVDDISSVITLDNFPLTFSVIDGGPSESL